MSFSAYRSIAGISRLLETYQSVAEAQARLFGPAERIHQQMETLRRANAPWEHLRPVLETYEQTASLLDPYVEMQRQLALSVEPFTVTQTILQTESVRCVLDLQDRIAAALTPTIQETISDIQRRAALLDELGPRPALTGASVEDPEVDDSAEEEQIEADAQALAPLFSEVVEALNGVMEEVRAVRDSARRSGTISRQQARQQHEDAKKHAVRLTVLLNILSYLLQKLLIG